MSSEPEPGEPGPSVDDLVAAEVEAEVEQHRARTFKELADNQLSMLKNIRTERRVQGFILLVALVVLAFFGVGMIRQGDTVSRLDALFEQFQADRLQAQRNSCRSYNDGLAAAHNGLVEEVIEFVAFLGTADATPDTPRSPEEQALVDQLIGQRVSEFETRLIPWRDCSDEGLEAFSEGAGGFLPAGSPRP